jgi:hypothetical protein
MFRGETKKKLKNSAARRLSGWRDMVLLLTLADNFPLPVFKERTYLEDVRYSMDNKRKGN